MVTKVDGQWYALYLANNQFGLSFLIPDAVWLTECLRRRLEVNRTGIFGGSISWDDLPSGVVRMVSVCSLLAHDHLSTIPAIRPSALEHQRAPDGHAIRSLAQIGYSVSHNVTAVGRRRRTPGVA